MSFEQWAPGQWAVFTATIAAGVITVAVLAVLRRWTAPALLQTAGPAPRPTITRAVTRVPLPGWIDPAEADFTDPGIGALPSIQDVAVDPALKTSAELRAEESSWINAYADLSGFMPETDAAAEQMRINLEPALRKAHLWRIRGERGSGDRALNDWRMGTKTGEYRMLTTADLRPCTRALPAS